jgi:Domain of unknown function (DUF4340)
MNARTLGLLALVTGLIAAIAAFSLNRRQSAEAAATDEGRFLPGLMEHINDVATMRVKTAGGEVTLKRGDDGWSVAEKGGYPAQDEPVKKTLIGLAELRKVEPKTDDPERWSKLGVEDPSAKDAASKLVTLEDASGKELASVIVGNKRQTQGGKLSELYVRGAGDQRAWLVQGDLDVKAAEKDWLQKEILKIDRDRVQSVRIEHPDGETLRVYKAAKEDPNFEVLGLAEGQELSYPGVAGQLANGLAYLNLDDVRPAGEIDFDADWLSKCSFWTFDGLRVDVTLKEADGLTYAGFHAAYDPDGANPVVGPAAAKPEPEAAPTPETAQAGEDGEAPAEDGDKTPAEDKKPQHTPEEVRAEAESLETRLSRWTYVIPQYNRTTFTKRLKDFLKPPPAPPKAPADGEAADAGEDDGTPYVIPGDLPPEIQEQIKAHQESLGHKVVVQPAKDEAAGDADDAGSADDGDAPAEPEHAQSKPAPEKGKTPGAEHAATPPGDGTRG